MSQPRLIVLAALHLMGCLHDGRVDGDSRQPAEIETRTCIEPDSAGSSAGPWHFTDATEAAGLADFAHDFADPDERSELRLVHGGVAAGDINGDCLADLYLLTGESGPDRLLLNDGVGSFTDASGSSGLPLDGAGGAPLLADLEGDGLVDLFIGSFQDEPARIYRNVGDAKFVPVAGASGVELPTPTLSAALGDYDSDGDLDLLVTHWRHVDPADPRRLWRNDGPAGFFDVTAEAGLAEADFDNWFTPNFADLDDDGRPDLLVAADWGKSEVLLNSGAGTFTAVTEDDVVTDENGMGAAVGDYDNDGDLDWFVSSIWDPSGRAEGHWGVSGNRLYQNRGHGRFQDVTESAGVRAGYWGWGSCFGDFDNDGDLDLFHVNGMGIPGHPMATEFISDPARLFVNNGDGTFTERARELGLDDTGQGRGVVCFDFDRDGDLDILIANNLAPPRLWRNEGGSQNHWLTVLLRGRPPNTHGIGARVEVTAGRHTQMRELRMGSNFASHDPAEAHFGLGESAAVDRLRVAWPSGAVTEVAGVAANRVIVVDEP